LNKYKLNIEKKYWNKIYKFIDKNCTSAIEFSDLSYFLKN